MTWRCSRRSGLPLCFTTEVWDLRSVWASTGGVRVLTVVDGHDSDAERTGVEGAAWSR